MVGREKRVRTFRKKPERSPKHEPLGCTSVACEGWTLESVAPSYAESPKPPPSMRLGAETLKERVRMEPEMCSATVGKKWRRQKGPSFFFFLISIWTLRIKAILMRHNAPQSLFWRLQGCGYIRERLQAKCVTSMWIGTGNIVEQLFPRSH